MNVLRSTHMVDNGQTLKFHGNEFETIEIIINVVIIVVLKSFLNSP